MKLRTRTQLGAVIAALFVGAVATAQSAGDGASDGAGNPVELEAQQDVNLTPAEQSARADQYLGEMERTGSMIRKQLQEARQARDVVKVLCLDDKLNQIDVALRSFKDRQASLKTAVERGDTDRARHEFSVLGVLRDRGQSLAAEANQCVGEEAAFIGDTEVELTIDPGIVDTDPSEYPDDPLISPPPVVSSPTS
ncbi:MAG: hypothetical protein KIT72_10360 [Polyangiaceae bacterium]|nr:hypothetical protein [Polyangiaceae bacterium]MCW5790814.1 hypothetical protein [Polyangiaceae bacterium]